MFFDKIKNIFKFKSKEVNLLLLEKVKIQNEVDELLTLGNYEMYFDLQKNGYEPTELQIKKIDDLIKNSLSGYTEKQELINNLLNCGLILTPTHVEQIFFNTSFMIYASKSLIKNEKLELIEITIELYSNIYKDYKENSKKYEEQINKSINEVWERKDKTSKEWINIADYIKPLLATEEYSNKLLSCWKTIVEKETISFDYLVIKPYKIMREQWKEKLSIEDYKKILTRINALGKKHSNDFTEREEVTTYIKEDYTILSDEKNKNLLKRTKATYVENNIEKNAILTQQDKVKNFSIKNLSKEIQTYIKSIENKCEQLSDNEDIEISFLVNNTIDKVLPETLRKFFSIDEEYRETLTNKYGKNAKDLLIESLKNIESNLSKCLENENEGKLKEMEANASYTKKLSY